MTPNPDVLRRVLLVVGGEYHDFDFVRRELLGLIAEDETLRTTCNADFHDTDALAAAHLLISYTGNVFPDQQQLEALQGFIERGGRWIAIHGAAAFTCFKPPEVDLGGIKLPGLTDTPDRQPAYMDTLGLRFVSHLATQPFTVYARSSHALVAGIEPFEVVDEPYILELRAEWNVLLEAHYTGEAPGYVAGPWLEDLPRPQVLIRRQGAGEIVYVAPGHACGRFDLRPFIEDMPVQRGPWISESYRDLLRRAIRWGTGRPMQPAPRTPVRDPLEEQIAVERVARRIDRAVDEKDWRAMRECLEDRVSVDIGVVSGSEILDMNADDFVGEIAALNAPGKVSYHSSTNAIVTVDAGTATLRSHSYGWNRCDVLEPPVYEVWGSMEYRLRRGPSGWRVTHIRMAKWREAGNSAVSELRGPIAAPQARSAR